MSPCRHHAARLRPSATSWLDSAVDGEANDSNGSDQGTGILVVASPATPEELFRALADPERLAVAGALTGQPMTANALAARLDLPIQRVRRHLSRLNGTGLVDVEADRRTYRLLPEALREAARRIGPPRDAGLALGAVFEEEEAVLRHYFREGRLREIPAKQSKRRIVLTRLALEFEAGSATRSDRSTRL